MVAAHGQKRPASAAAVAAAAYAAVTTDTPQLRRPVGKDALGAFPGVAAHGDEILIDLAREPSDAVHWTRFNAVFANDVPVPEEFAAPA